MSHKPTGSSSHNSTQITQCMQCTSLTSGEAYPRPKFILVFSSSTCWSSIQTDPAMAYPPLTGSALIWDGIENIGMEFKIGSNLIPLHLGSLLHAIHPKWCARQQIATEVKLPGHGPRVVPVRNEEEPSLVVTHIPGCHQRPSVKDDSPLERQVSDMNQKLPDGAVP